MLAKRNHGSRIKYYILFTFVSFGGRRLWALGMCNLWWRSSAQPSRKVSFCWDSLWQQHVSILLPVGQGDRWNRFQILLISQCEDLEAVLWSEGISLYFTLIFIKISPETISPCPSAHSREREHLPLLTANSSEGALFLTMRRPRFQREELEWELP